MDMELEGIAASVGNFAQARLEVAGWQGVGHIVILVNNLAAGGSDQVTATNIDAADAAEVLRYIAGELERGVAPVGEVL